MSAERDLFQHYIRVQSECHVGQGEAVAPTVLTSRNRLMK